MQVPARIASASRRRGGADGRLEPLGAARSWTWSCGPGRAPARRSIASAIRESGARFSFCAVVERRCGSARSRSRPPRLRSRKGRPPRKGRASGSSSAGRQLHLGERLPGQRERRGQPHAVAGSRSRSGPGGSGRARISCSDECREVRATKAAELLLERSEVEVGALVVAGQHQHDVGQERRRPRARTPSASRSRCSRVSGSTSPTMPKSRK